MKKIPTIFLRTPDQKNITREPNPAALWVFAGEGYPMVKLDGMGCAIIDGALHKRREVKAGTDVPKDFIQADFDETTGNAFGWVPVNFADRQDVWFKEGYQNTSDLRDGTYELIGPKVQGGVESHISGGVNMLIRHDDVSRLRLAEFSRDFEGIKAEFERYPHVEGIVWHHPDGRMAKIKLRDFKIPRKPRAPVKTETPVELPADVQP